MRTALTLALILIITLGSSAGRSTARAAATQAIDPPVLKWQRGGCTSWCETGWYSSPAVADLNHDGNMEVIAAAYSLYILNGKTGAAAPGYASIAAPGGGRTWSGVVAADINGDGDVEIVTAHGGGYLRVLSHTGALLWQVWPATSELRSLAVYDLNGDGQLEIIVAVAGSISRNQWYVYTSSGAPVSGWPQLSSGAPGYAVGCYNNNIGVGDLNGDGRGEIIGPSDVHYITAYADGGAQLPANARYGSKVWSQVGVHVSDAVDLRGYANCGTEHRPNFADSAPTLADVNHDGVLEVVVVGNVYNCGTSPYTDLYDMPFIFKADRSRWSGGAYDWTTIPTPDGSAAPLSEDYNVIETAEPNPVVADIDGDGNMEILFASYDGRVHAYWLDKTEHGTWPYKVASTGTIRFASEPVVADLDNNGRAEIIFTTWTQKGSNQTGQLVILDSLGNLLQAVTLPAVNAGANWNGALAAPTLADIDGDGVVEVVVNTADSGVAAYELPGTVADARVLWGTGRGNYQRTGSYLYGSLLGSTLAVQPQLPRAGDTLTYTLNLRNPGPALPGVRLTDTLPAEGIYLDNLWASAGTYGYASNVITWTGSVQAAVPVTLTFSIQVRPEVTMARLITNVVTIDDRVHAVLPRSAWVIANAYTGFLPLVRR